MLSIGKLGQGQANYYLESVAQGVEDYYTGAGEAPGRWVGSAAREIGIAGKVDDDALHAALGGSHPRTGDQLASRRGGTRVPGFDLTFSAPKSVSVVFGLADEGVSAQVCGAHETAVDAALAYIERQAAVARRGAGGAESVAGNGFLGAAFRHRSSRAGDPHLHTHVLVANMTKGPDGRWTALDARRLYAHAKTAGYLYQAQLRAELSRRLGVEWTVVRNGTAEIAGVPVPVVRAFSRRRAEIVRVLDERGESSQTAARMAALDTRQAKDYGVEPDTLRSGWREASRRLGFDRDQLDAVLQQRAAHEPELARLEVIAAELASPRGLTSHRASFTRRDVIHAFCDRLPEGVDVPTAERFADDFLASEHTVPLATDVRSLTHADVIRRSDGRTVAATAEERCHSTPELLAAERRLIEGALARRDEGVAVVASGTVDAALTRRPTLGADQAEMVRRLTRHGDGVAVVTGKAGTGKTFALDAAREAWEASGHPVIGAAVARRAARELEDGAGIESTSLAALLQDLRAGGEYGLPPRSVVVLDEAGMAGTRQLGELLAHAETARAKVVLVGDPHQLPEIDAGGSFRALLTRTQPIELTENRRQGEAWEREALDHLREGRAEEAIDRYQRHGRIVLGEGAQDIRKRLVADWWQASGEGDAAMIALRRSDVADLNDRARALMRASGRLGPDGLRVGERDFAVGDQVVTLKNAGRLDVVNGTRGIVTAIDQAAGELALRTTDGRDLCLPRVYLEDETERGGPTLDHGYAITGHKAQGMTTEKAFVLGSDDLYREWGYVAMSRGSEENRLYVVAPSARERHEYAPVEHRPDPLGRVAGELGRSHAQVAAIDVAARDGLTRMTTAELVTERTRLAEGIGATPDVRVAELERIAEQRSTAERAADAARRRAGEGARSFRRRFRRDPPSAAADRAIEAQARGRARQLVTRERELEAAIPAPSRRSPERARQVARYAAIGEELDRRHRTAVRAALVARPDYLVAELGSYPERPSARRAWGSAATGVETYRQAFGVNDAKSALGHEPSELLRRRAWRDARREIEQAQREFVLAPRRAWESGRERR
ncbi:MAG TPA: MobF family relaxase [Thermoleophilaceae bacterium]